MSGIIEIKGGIGKAWAHGEDHMGPIALKSQSVPMRARVAPPTVPEGVGNKSGLAIRPDRAMLSLLVPRAPIPHDPC